MGIKYTSVQMTFIGGRRYRPGQVFELPDGMRPAPNMKRVSEPAIAKAPGKSTAPAGSQKAAGGDEPPLA